MKLLPKKQVSIQIAQQRKAQIDEGVKLAEKVDILRRLEADEEENIRKFRDGSLKIVHKEIDSLLSEKESLEKDILELREKRKNLIPPLEEDVDRFYEAQKELDGFRKILEKKETQLENIEAEILERNEISKEKSSQINSRNVKTIEEYEMAEELKMEAQKSLLQTQEYVKKELQMLEKRENEIKTREKGLISFETTLKLREETIEMKEEEIVQEKIRLLDQRQTLERAMARLQ